VGVHPREWAVPDDGHPEYVGPDPLRGCTGVLVGMLLTVAVVLVLGLLWLAVA